VKTYEVVIETTVTKTITVNADDKDKAEEKAHEQFNKHIVGDIRDEYYGLDTLSIEEIES
jgi:hypothetical protein